jgi:hypothetical protein
MHLFKSQIDQKYEYKKALENACKELAEKEAQIIALREENERLEKDKELLAEEISALRYEITGLNNRLRAKAIIWHKWPGKRTRRLTGFGTFACINPLLCLEIATWYQINQAYGAVSGHSDLPKSLDRRGRNNEQR